MSDDSGVVAGSAGERSAVSGLLLDVADDGSLGQGSEGKHVADGEGGLLSAEDESAGRESLGGDEGLGAHLVAVRVAEDDAREGRSTSRVVDDLLDEATDVTVALGEVEGAELGGTLPVVGVSLEDSSALTLVANDCESTGRKSAAEVGGECKRALGRAGPEPSTYHVPF